MRNVRIAVLLAIMVIAPAAWCQWSPYMPPEAAGAAPAPAAPALPAGPAPNPLVPAPAAPAPGTPPAPPRIEQVQLHVWISEMNEQGMRNLGANLEYTRVIKNGTSRFEKDGSIRQVSTSVFNPNDTAYSVTLPAPDAAYFPASPTTGNNMLRPDNDKNPSNGVPGQLGGGLVTSIVDTDYGTLDSVFRGVDKTADVDLLSKPELLVIDNGIAEIHAGEQVPYQSVSYNVIGGAQLGVKWKDVGVNLKLQPLVLTNDTIQIDITDLSVSDVSRYETIRSIQMPVFSVRSQAGRVIVPNGQTIVIGGLSSRSVTRSERRVPIIGELPLIGIPFRGRTSSATNSNLLIFVQPTSVNLRNLTEESKSALTFWKERHWENTERISKEIAAMQDGM